MKSAETIKAEFKALLRDSDDLAPNEAITLLSTLNGYIEAKTEALQEAQGKRKRRSPGLLDLPLGGGE